MQETFREPFKPLHMFIAISTKPRTYNVDYTSSPLQSALS